MTSPVFVHVRIRRVLAAVTLACALVFAIVVATRAVARRFIFPRGRVVAVGAPDATPRTFFAKDGARVRAFELEGPPGAPVIVHFHNNRETAETSAPLARALNARGFGVLLVEYRGYGASMDAGAPSEEGLYLDAEAALDALSSRGVAASRIVLWGTSLGTGVAAEMARQGRGAALVLVTPYTSIPDLAVAAVPFLPARVLVGDRFETLSKAPAIVVPTLVVHGDADEIVPFWMGARVSEALAHARLLRVAGGRHGDLFVRAGDRLLDAIAALARRATHA